ncbi:hypothetical protein GCM10020216_038360 [Nonomuraea helvata]
MNGQRGRGWRGGDAFGDGHFVEGGGAGGDADQEGGEDELGQAGQNGGDADRPSTAVPLHRARLMRLDLHRGGVPAAGMGLSS